MDRKRALIYPYNSDSTYFFRHSNMNREFDVVGAVAPNGWGLTGKDAGGIDGGENIGILIKNSFEEYNDEFDSVILTNSPINLDFEKIIYKNIDRLVHRGKDIVCFRDLEPSYIMKISELCEKNGTSFRYCPKREDYQCLDANILDINVPVIFVAGMTERTQKFEIQLSLREEIMNMGYRVSQIGTKNHCDIFGFFSFPDFMLSNKLSNSDKIVMFNRFVKAIEVNQAPDVIIIGIPGGIMPINKTFTEGFGVMAYMMAQAIKPDAAVLSVPYGEYKTEYFKELGTMTKYRLGYPIDCINIANAKFDYTDSEIYNKKCYTIIDSDYIDKKITSYGENSKPVFNILNTNDKIKMASHIIDVLAGEEAIEDVL